MWELDYKESWALKNWCFWTVLLEKTLESPLHWRRSNQPSLKKSVLNIYWKDSCWSWNSNTLATWCEELTHLKRPWCWERFKAGWEVDDIGWDGWMASLTQWTWVWVNSGSWWWTGRPGVLQCIGLQRVGHGWATELNWIFPNSTSVTKSFFPGGNCFHHHTLYAHLQVGHSRVDARVGGIEFPELSIYCSWNPPLLLTSSPSWACPQMSWRSKLSKEIATDLSLQTVCTLHSLWAVCLSRAIPSQKELSSGIPWAA